MDTSISALKLVRLVTLDLFISGSHVDFYDNIAGIDGDGSGGVTTCCGCANCMCGPDCACVKASAPQCDSCTDAMKKK